MKNITSMLWISLPVVVGVLTGAAVLATELPSQMSIINGGEAPGPAETAQKNVLALNTMMFELYGDAGRVIGQNIRAQHPIILGLFSGAGGRLILYRPGQPPLDAPPVPPVYQLLKSIGHSTMAIAVAIGPTLEKPADQSWLSSLQAYRARMQVALDSLEASGMPSAWTANNRRILEINIVFLDECLARKAVSYESFRAFAASQAPLLKNSIAWAAETQVRHWMDVLTAWKQLVGADWNKTYAASNTIYVARQNNVLFSVLAQFFGPEAINDRLILIETVSFTTTPDDMLESLTRIIADRTVGANFFGNDRLMDYELMGGDARNAIMAEATRRGMVSFLPPVVPFGSRQWPTLVTPGPGPASLADLP